jgi:hypothetical protein
LGWIVVGIKQWSKIDFPDPILDLKHDDGTINWAPSYELVKEEVWLQYYGQSDLIKQDIWLENISKSNLS